MKGRGLVLLVGVGVAGLIYYALTHAPTSGALTQELRNRVDEERQQAEGARRALTLRDHLQALRTSGGLPTNDPAELARRAIWSN